MKKYLFAAALASMLIGGAIVLKITDASFGPPPVRAFIASEAFHIPAHLLLYGALARACQPLFGSRQWMTFGAVLVVGMAQEAAQSLVWGRAPGNGELFDLVVDATATLFVLVSTRWVTARRLRLARS